MISLTITRHADEKTHDNENDDYSENFKLAPRKPVTSTCDSHVDKVS